jgi:hypothetical protein
MRKSAVNVERLSAVGSSLGDAVIDPAIWPNILEQITAAAGAAGAALLRSDIETPDIPRTASTVESFKHYFAAGWHTRNPLAQRGFPLLGRGQKVISDQDVVTAEEMKCLDFYNEFLVSFGFQWFAGIGFAAGSALWGVLILRAPQQGPFEENEKRVLAWLSPRLAETATLSEAVGRTALLGVSNALHRLGHPALALDRMGFVLAANESAEEIFDDEIYIRNRRLTVREPEAKSALADLIDQLRATPDTAALPAAPIIVRRDKAAARDPHAAGRWRGADTVPRRPRAAGLLRSGQQIRAAVCCFGPNFPALTGGGPARLAHGNGSLGGAGRGTVWCFSGNHTDPAESHLCQNQHPAAERTGIAAVADLKTPEAPPPPKPSDPCVPGLTLCAVRVRHHQIW